MHSPITEQSNPESNAIDSMSALDMVRLMNAEDQKVAVAVQGELRSIAQGAESIAEALAQGGRLIYLGAGTSGRLGVLDASECPPTFNTTTDQVIGIIAGGYRALTTAIEGAEDDSVAAVLDLKQQQFSARDVLVGIATSGQTPYVVSGLKYGRELGARTIGITCNTGSDLEAWSDILIAPIVGPEVISGSTRLKAGTATKMILNMLTTTAMVLLGKTYGHWMVDLRATNRKLKARSVRIVAAITKLEASLAEQHLQACAGEVKTAIVSALCAIEPEAARERLTQARGRLRAALEMQSKE